MKIVKKEDILDAVKMDVPFTVIDDETLVQIKGAVGDYLVTDASEYSTVITSSSINDSYSKVEVGTIE